MWLKMLLPNIKKQNNYEGFQLEMIRLFSVDIEISQDEFADQLY